MAEIEELSDEAGEYTEDLRRGRRGWRNLLGFSPRLERVFEELPALSAGRVRRRLWHLRCLTVSQVTAISKKELLDTGYGGDNFGRTSVRALEDALARFELTIKDPSKRQVTWQNVEQIAAYVAGDGTDPQRVALADGIREGRR